MSLYYANFSNSRHDTASAWIRAAEPVPEAESATLPIRLDPVSDRDPSDRITRAI